LSSPARAWRWPKSAHGSRLTASRRRR
jgi:hypothetical protein